jgi:hypothetical protein
MSPLTGVTAVEEVVDLEVRVPVVAVPYLGVPAEECVALGEQKDRTVKLGRCAR